jgi:ech hydrogenase subunit F
VLEMLKVTLSNLFSKPATRRYPYTVREPYEMSRGQISFSDTSCVYCTLCAKKCPADAIKVDRATKTWELDAYRCIICGECATACPKKSISMCNERRKPTEDKVILTYTKEASEDKKDIPNVV